MGKEEETQVEIYTDPQKTTYTLGGEQRYTETLPMFVKKAGEKKAYINPITIGPIRSRSDDNYTHMMCIQINVNLDCRVFKESDRTIFICVKDPEISEEELDEFIFGSPEQ